MTWAYLVTNLNTRVGNRYYGNLIINVSLYTLYRLGNRYYGNLISNVSLYTLY